jgi:hypothetical protein
VSVIGVVTTARFWKIFGGAIFGLLLLCVGAGFAFVHQAGGLSQLVEQRLNKISDRLIVAVADAGLGVRMSARPLTLKIDNMRIKLDQSHIVVPAAEFEFGFASLLTRQPEKLVLRGLDLDLVKTATGWNIPKIMGVTGSLLGQTGQGGEIAKTLAMLKIGIGVTSMTLSDATGALPKVRFSDLFFDFESLANGSLVGSIRGRHDAEIATAGDFTATVTGWPGGNRFAVDVTAQQLHLTDFAGYIDQIPDEFKTLGTVSGHVGVNVEDAEIAHLEADIALQNGGLATSGIFTDPAYGSANVIGTYARSQQALNIAKLEMMMADGRELSFVGGVNDIGTSSVSFAGGVKAGNFALRTILADWPEFVAANYRSFIEAHVDGGYLQDGTAQIAGRYNPVNGALSLSQFDFDGDFSGLRVNAATDQYRRAVGTVDGNFSVRMGAMGKIDALDLAATVTDGSILLTGRDAPVLVSAANIQTQFTNDRTLVSGLTADFGPSGKMSLSANIGVDDENAIETSAIEINADDFDAALFTALWPARTAPVTRRWLHQNMPSGRMRDAKLSFHTRYDADSGRHKLDDIKGNWRLHDTTLGWSDQLPPFTDLSADLSIDNTTFLANISTANFGGMSVQHGNVTISPVVGDNAREAQLSISIKGALDKALNHARTSGLTTLAAIDVTDVTASGEAEMILQAAFPLGEKINALKAIQKLDATISNGSFANLPGTIHIDNAELVAAFDKDRSDVSGTASFMGAPAEFTVQFDREKDRVKAVGLASPSPELAAVLARRLNLELDGRLGGKLEYTGDLVQNTAELKIAAPLTGVSIDVPVLNWAKLPAESGQASMVIDLRGGELAAVNNIDIVAGSLVAQGQVIFDTAGAMQAGFFERVAWPGNDIRDLIIESNQDKSWQVGANAKIIDLVPLRRNKGVSGGETVNFDFTADQIIVDNQISLSGQLVGARSAQGAGEAEFSGSLLVRGEPLITEAQFGIVFGTGDETITGVGLIGGGETDFNFTDGVDGKPTLVLTSKNGGRMLSGLDITDTVRGGDVRLQTIFDSDDYKNYDTSIDITDFAVVEAPRAIKALSVLSLAGLYALVEGDGTAFKIGHAELETSGSVVNIKALKASGDAVAVSMVGVYDRASKQVDVSGNLVPVSQISTIVGKLPVLGNVLTGLDKSGIFATQFRVTGQSDDMQTSVNPASIAPGLLRDLISPNWLGKESDRFFNKTPDATDEAALDADGSQVIQ